MTKIIKQEVNVNGVTGLTISHTEHDVLAENANEFAILNSDYNGECFLVIAKPHRVYGGHKIDAIFSHVTHLTSREDVVTIIRYSLDDGCDKSDFIDIANQKLTEYDSTANLMISHDGHLEEIDEEIAA